MPDPTADLLLKALRDAPRRYRLPPLPADLAAAEAGGIEPTLAFTIEAARLRTAADAERQAFTRALAQLIRAAMARGADAGFQAVVLQASDPTVQEHVRLSQRLAADQRTVRSAVDAIAHPGKLRGAPHDGLAALHGLADAGDWPALAQRVAQLEGDTDGQRATLAQLRASAALKRLVRGHGLQGAAVVQRYRALVQQQGPAAGTPAAAAQGRAALRTGDAAEHETVQAFRAIAALLPTGVKVLRSLRTPAGFPGAATRSKAKDEWDVALLQGDDIVLLAEVKASPAAASSDFSRLQRGLQRLAQADPQRSYTFWSADGDVAIAGRTLRALQPGERQLPAHVIYCCTAAPEAQPQVLSTASKAVLAAEPASIAFAQSLAAGGSPAASDLDAVWQALTAAPRLRAALHQDETARIARAAMLHPDDLLAAVQAQVRR